MASGTIKNDFSFYVQYLSSVDFVQLMFTSYTIATILGIIVVQWPKRVPRFMANVIFSYGQLKDYRVTKSNSVLMILLKVPKSVFTHFYTASLIVHGIVTCTIFWSYSTGRSVPYIVTVLDILTSDGRKADVKPMAVLVVTTLFMCQIVRRWYECYFVSVYSDSHMSVFHYLTGITFYLGLSCALVAQAPGFTSQGFDLGHFANFDWDWCELFGCAMYFWAAWHQHKCTVILADLRKQSGKVTTKKHKIPYGDWFGYISCPHYLTEILIYVALNIILGCRNTTWILASLFTLINQVFYAVLKHRWYQDMFKEYPKQRKAILPFLL